MNERPPVTVLRLGHRPGRDERTTTHVGLTARALGADRLILEDVAAGRRDTVADITDRFGGPFEVTVTDAPLGQIRNWDGAIAHLTMYGEPVQAVTEDIQARHHDGPLLVVVGAEKVPFEVYEHADWNVGVTNQPHSEIAALAVFLDRLFEGRELDREFEDAEKRVIPKETGKRVVDSKADPQE
ncbi:tRNA (cytidine(56)-2'-O)-methyltransferase [Halorhabdus salina]|uniref:tRNA (cytidine(56)-2'-O)-methyltransferase n=1 Tax=Halorhabdus salina TaxID=2750670 RepID=UPI0015EF9F5F|nr:tRNA (cytidine(56)-2'-O)-methyltransferase [Halorhabdus salina]